MKPHIQKLPLSEQSSFLADTFYTPSFETPWHYHEELELVLILEGKGKRFVGNHVSDFCEGQVDLLGSNLPHWYRKDDTISTGGSLVIHFREEFLGKSFGEIPEMLKIRLLFDRSRMGIKILGATQQKAALAMKQILTLNGMDRLTALLLLLSQLAESEEYELLSSPELNSQNKKDSDRLNKVFSYVMNHFKEEISVEEVADLAMMSYSGFCRYFKNRTKKNFSHFVNEIRIGYACKRLLNSDLNVSHVCYESGFNNIANFNKQFKKIVRCTPHQFQQKIKL
ncbi:helix-turn-helix transcriptional regulator [Adhaeribacter radiodurans]|uniref:Helix-turn-helix transcriptional regulator n=2 Tax=Adhaeribacter radiodurans TaxID=2745197 RepID=A0A7L7L755_9BACT|nr:helix-turn-helix transcriptional regulator [Adhaeribacter radiodurans]